MTQENKKQLTEIVFILDASGSMHGLESDTIGGFNSMLDKQKKIGGTAYVSTVLFDDETKVIHDRQPIERIAPMTDRDYSVGGCTALLDAVGGAIHHIGNVHKYAREEDRPAKTLFVIITDGEENASREYTYDKVKHMITRQQEKYGWNSCSSVPISTPPKKPPNTASEKTWQSTSSRTAKVPPSTTPPSAMPSAVCVRQAVQALHGERRSTRTMPAAEDKRT